MIFHFGVAPILFLLTVEVHFHAVLIKFYIQRETRTNFEQLRASHNLCSILTSCIIFTYSHSSLKCLSDISFYILICFTVYLINRLKNDVQFKISCTLTLKLVSVNELDIISNTIYQVWLFFIIVMKSILLQFQYMN